MVVAWRLAFLMRLGRTYPELSVELFLEEHEWQAAYFLLEKKLPKKIPKVGEVVRLIGMLGGFIGRKSDGEPGVQSIWIGWQRIKDASKIIEYTSIKSYV